MRRTSSAAREAKLKAEAQAQWGDLRPPARVVRRHAAHINEEQASALEITNDEAKNSDLALHDVIQELALKLSDNESKMVADIDQALMRMEEGSYGKCVRCGREIDERRLEARLDS